MQSAAAVVGAQRGEGRRWRGGAVEGCARLQEEEEVSASHGVRQQVGGGHREGHGHVAQRDRARAVEACAREGARWWRLRHGAEVVRACARAWPRGGCGGVRAAAGGRLGVGAAWRRCAWESGAEQRLEKLLGDGAGRLRTAATRLSRHRERRRQGRRAARLQSHAEELPAALHQALKDGHPRQQADGLGRMQGGQARAVRRHELELLEEGQGDCRGQLLVPHDACAVHARLVLCRQHERRDHRNRVGHGLLVRHQARAVREGEHRERRELAARPVRARQAHEGRRLKGAAEEGLLRAPGTGCLAHRHELLPNAHFGIVLADQRRHGSAS